MSEQIKIEQNAKRLDVLRDLAVLNSGTEKVYDDITQITAELCEAPICMISLVEEDRQWFKSEVGLGIRETPIEQSVCAHAVAQNSYLEISDTQNDPRTRDNSLCHGDRAVRFYAGAILKTLEGWPLGTLCVLDFKPRELSDLQRRVLEVHAKSVTRQLELTKALIQKVRQTDYRVDTTLISDNEKKMRQETQRRFDILTPREKEVMNLIAGHSGSLTSKEIARNLNISHRTVHHHRANIMTKMDVDSVAELIAISFKANLFRPL